MKGWDDWRTWASSDARPEDIPPYPNIAYRGKGWAGMGDRLGNEYFVGRYRNFLAFKDARNFVQSLRLKNCVEWRAWSKSSDRPKNIPSAPREVYEKEGWKGFGDWLGTPKELGQAGRIACRKMVFRPFRKARAYARNLGLKSLEEWDEWAKGPERPKDIPRNADRTYKNKGWKGWADWLGTGRIYKNSYGHRSFEEAREYARSLRLKNSLEWFNWCKSGGKPKDIPYQPSIVYRGDGWINYADWLGRERPGRYKKNGTFACTGKREHSQVEEKEQCT